MVQRTFSISEILSDPQMKYWISHHQGKIIIKFPDGKEKPLVTSIRIPLDPHVYLNYLYVAGRGKLSDGWLARVANKAWAERLLRIDEILIQRKELVGPELNDLYNIIGPYCEPKMKESLEEINRLERF